MVSDSATAFLELVKKCQFTALSSCAVFTLLLHSGRIKRLEMEGNHTSYFFRCYGVQLMPESSSPYWYRHFLIETKKSESDKMCVIEVVVITYKNITYYNTSGLK